MVSFMMRNRIGRTAGSCLLLLISGTAMGDEAVRPSQAPSWQAPPRTAPMPGAAEVPRGDPARAPTIAVDPAACRWVQRHEPAPDVAYTPGVDARGRAVAPADLPGSQSLALPETIEIGITVPLAERFGVPKDALYKGEAYVGTVTVRDGRVLFNGRPVAPAAEGELVALCRKQGIGR